MASITKTARGYRAQLYVRGVRDSCTFRTQREAAAWASARETELRADAKKTPGELYTVRQAFEKYRDEVAPKKRGARGELIRVGRLLNSRDLPLDLPIGELSATHIAAYRDARLKVVKSSTVLREMTVISAMLSVAKREWRWIDHNPKADVSNPPEPPHRERVITRGEIKAMLRSLGYSRRGPRTMTEAIAYAFLLSLRTGMRAGEICALRWDQVRDDYLAGVGTKTDPRDVPLSYQARKLIERLKGWDVALVVAVTSATLDALFRRHRQLAGLSGFTFHDARHTAATWQAQKLHVLDLCKAFGWRGTKRALTYYNPSASDIAKRLSPGRSR